MKKFRSTTSWFAALALAATPAALAEHHEHKDKDKDKDHDAKEERRVDDSDATNSPDADKMDPDGTTTMDQHNTEEAIEKTAAIRRALMEDDDLSMSAKNAQIITTETGRVHLRGEVKNAAEKAKIENLAKEAAPGSRIQNDLKVKAED